MCKIVKNRETPYKIWKNVAYKCKNKDRRVEKKQNDICENNNKKQNNK
jgi:hypothetical protein